MMAVVRGDIALVEASWNLRKPMSSRPQDASHRKAIRDAKLAIGHCTIEGCNTLAVPYKRCLSHRQQESHQRHRRAAASGRKRWKRGKFNIQSWHMHTLLNTLYRDEPYLRQDWVTVAAFVEAHPDVWFDTSKVDMALHNSIGGDMVDWDWLEINRAVVEQWQYFNTVED